MHPDLIAALDYRHLWHPYTDATTYEALPHCCIERSQGVYLYDHEGRPLLDGISSWWCVSLGHGQPSIIEAIQQQAATLQHCIVAGMTHAPAVWLAERIARLCPGDLNRVYFASDGSCAAEAAMKMAVQYWSFRGEPQRTRFLALEQGYHGDTLGAIAVGFTSWFQEPFGPLLKPALLAPTPHCPSSDPAECETHAAQALEAFAAMMAEHHRDLAAVMLEPLCQGAAGIWIYPESYLVGVRDLCDQYGVLLIADEIAVGLGRTGALWACDRARIVPDIMCIGKALTGGYLPMSAAVATDRLFSVFQSTDGVKRVFWDGHTFCGNPITAAAAIAALALFEALDIPHSCAALERRMADGFKHLARHPGVRYHKTLGMIGMCAFDDTPEGAARAYACCQQARQLGLFTRPLGPTVYLWPPLTSTPTELDTMLDILDTVISRTA